MDLTPLVHDAAQLLHKELSELTQLCPLVLRQSQRPLQLTDNQLSLCWKLDRSQIHLLLECSKQCKDIEQICQQLICRDATLLDSNHQADQLSRNRCPQLVLQ